MRRLSQFGSATCLGLVLTSPVCFALGEQILAQHVDVINIAMIALGAVLILLLASLIRLKFKLKGADKKFTIQQDALAANKSQLDGFNVGILHLNPSGEIIYANRFAAYFLGNNPEQVLNKPLAGMFDDAEQETIGQGLASEEYCRLQLFIASRNRHVVFGFKPQSKIHNNVANIISVEDVSDLQTKLDQTSQRLTQHMHLFDRSQLGQLSIDLENETFSANAVFAQLLGSVNGEIKGELPHLNELIYQSDSLTWKHAIKQLEKGEQVNFNCRFVLPEGHLPCQVFGLVAQRDDDGEAQILHLAIQDQSELDQHRSQNRVSQQQVKGLLRASPSAMYIFDRQGKLQNCNRAFETLFNTKLGKIQDLDVSEFDFFPQDIKKIHPQGESSGTGMVSSASVGSDKEFELSMADDSIHTLRVKVQSFQDDKGKRAGVIGVIEDITPLKQAQQELEQERTRFAGILDMAPVAIAMIDADDHIIQANKAMTERLGLNEKELKKGSLYQLFNDPNNSGKAAKQLHKTGRLRAFHAHLKGKNNELHPSELHIDLFNKVQQEYLCWISDISDEQFQQDKFEGLLTHSSMPMAVLDDLGFTQLNPAACEFFSIEDENELFGFFPYSPSLNNDDEAANRLKQKIAQIRVDGQAQSMVWQHKIGEQPLPCHATYVPMYKGQELDSILCIWTDLRAIKQADAARMQAINLHQAAEREIVEKQQLLESSQDQLASKVRTLSDTENRLQAAQVDLSENQDKITDLQQAHQSISDHLHTLQQDYSQNRELLAQSERSNANLETQLEKSSAKVGGLEKQRNQIADALQYSEKQYQRAQHELAESEKNTERLQQEQQEQQQKMEGFVSQIDSLKHAIEEKDQQIHGVSTQINALQSQLSSSGQNSEKLRQLLVNQRKASEEAEQQRRKLELSCHSAQSEVSSKARHIDHLQHEMQKFEEMSNQQKGDMEQQQKLLQQELQAKQNQLQETKQALDETLRQSEQEKAEKLEQQQHLEKLQQEHAEVERLTNEQQQKMAEAEQETLEQQRLLQEELMAKQQKLQETEQILSEAKQQTEAEKAEKARQQLIFDQLQAELDEVEQRTAQQQQQIAQSDEQWQERQLELKRELDAKQQQLQESQDQLDENQRLADAEKRERQEQQQKLEQVKVELADVESRALKQREMMEGSDEQWREHHAEIEQQKVQLQQALQEAEKQNSEMQKKLKGSVQELQEAESQVSQTQSGEKKLQEELNHARQQAEELQQRLLAQEEQEAKLQQQLSEQQKVLQDGEQNIHALQDEQKQLTQELQTVQQEYTSTKQNMSTQDSNQSELAEQLNNLEKELQDSKQQLDSKENALQEAQLKLESSQVELVEQEQALVAAHKEELKLAQEESSEMPKHAPEFAKLAMPVDPDVWFNLLPYLQKNPKAGPLAVALNTLIEELESVVQATDKAVNEDDTTKILLNTRKLVAVANRVNSEPLIDLATRLEAYCQQGQVDSISIFWPNVKKSLMITLRVIYSQLHA